MKKKPSDETKAEIRERLLKYGRFSPQGIELAIRAAVHLPVPKDPDEVARLGTKQPGGKGWFRRSIDLPPGVMWVFVKYARSRGVSVARVLQETLAYYAVGVSEDSLYDVPSIYQDLRTPEGVAALAAAMKIALEEMQASTSPPGAGAPNVGDLITLAAPPPPAPRHLEEPGAAAPTTATLPPPLSPAALAEIEEW